MSLDESVKALISYRLESAREKLSAAEDLCERRHYKDSVSRSYYAIFTAARALLAVKCLDSTKHSGVIALVNQHFVKSGDGKHVDFYVAYYESQRKGESIHSPETCLPGSEWIFQQAGQAQAPIAGQGGSIKVNRAIMEKSGVQQVSYFWFPARGRILTNAWEMKFFNFWDALTRQRTEGALVRVITVVYPDEGIENAETRF